MLNGIALILHLIAINVWIGGTFFSIVILGRAIKNVETHQQLLLWQLIFTRFFTWAWISVFAIVGSGTWLIYRVYGGIGNIPLHIRLMGIIALLMISVFLFIYLVPYRQYKQLVPTGDVDACVRKLATIRLAGTVNMFLGLCIVIVIGGGRFFLY